MQIDPTASVLRPIVAWPRATALAEPDEDPPGMRPGAEGLLTGVQDEHVGGVDGEHVWVSNDPAGGCPAGSVVFGVSVWCSVCRGFGNCCAG